MREHLSVTVISRVSVSVTVTLIVVVERYIDSYFILIPSYYFRCTLILFQINLYFVYFELDFILLKRQLLKSSMLWWNKILLNKMVSAP